MNTEEEWRPIVGYEGVYEVSNLGRIKSLQRYKVNGWGSLTLLPEIVMKPKPTPQGYMQIGLRNPTQKLFYVHRLVALHFIPNPRGVEEVNHKNGNKAINCVSNLEWVSPGENIQHSFDAGLRGKTRKRTAKLNDEKALAIYHDTRPTREIVREYGTSRWVVRSIKLRKAWTHIHKNENPD